MEQAISSGPSRGRAVMGNLSAALGAFGKNTEAEIEANVELVETLKSAADEDERRSRPSALVLPVGSCADEDRWFDNLEWHDIRPGTREFLAVPPDAEYRALVHAAYERFRDYAAAGVAYHF